MRVLLQEHARGAGGADQGQHVDEPALHHRAHDRGPLAGDHVDRAPREALLQRRGEQCVREDAVARRLHHHRVPHHERGDHGGEHLVHRVVVGAETQRHAERRAADARDEAAGRDGRCRVLLDLPQRLGRRLDVLDGAVELLEAVRPRLAHLPHQRAGDRLAQRPRPAHEVEHACDALAGTGPRPLASAPRPGARRGRDGLARELRAREGAGPEREPLRATVRVTHAHGRADLVARSVPQSQRAADEQREAGVVGRAPGACRDLVRRGKQGLEIRRWIHRWSSDEGARSLRETIPP